MSAPRQSRARPDNTNWKWLQKEIKKLKQLVGKGARELDRLRLQAESTDRLRGLLRSGVEWSQRTISGDEYGIGRVFIVNAPGELGEVKARTKVSGNILDTDPESTLSFTTDASYSGGGYYEATVLLEKKSYFSSQMEIVVYDARGEPEARHAKTFDPDTDPGFDDFGWDWGVFGSVTSGKFPLYGWAKIDEDGLSWEYGTPSSDPTATPVDGAYTSCVNETVTDVVLLGEFDPEDVFWLVARARSGASCSGDKAEKPKGLRYIKIETPVDPTATGTIPNNSISLHHLVLGMQTVDYTGTFSHHASTPYRRVQWTSGTLTYGDGTSYAINSGNRLLNIGAAPDMEHAYFDPDVDTNDFQWTTDLGSAHATTSNPKRVLMAMARSVASGVPGNASEYAFLLANGTSDIFFSAAIAKFGTLEALFGIFDDLTVKDSLTMGTGGVITNASSDFTIDSNGFEVEALSAGVPSFSGSRGFKIYEGGTLRAVLWHSTTANVAVLRSTEGLQLETDNGPINIGLEAGDPINLGSFPTPRDEVNINAGEVNVVTSNLVGSGDIVLTPGGGDTKVTSGDLIVTNDIEADSLRLPGTTNPTTPASGEAAVYFHNFASGSDFVGFEVSSGVKFLFPAIDTLESSPVMRTPIDESDLYDDTTPGAASATEMYLPIRTQDGENYYIRLYQT